MIYFFTGIVFVAELIIAATIIVALIKFDKKFIKLSSLINDVKPEIRELSELCRKISEQWIEIAQDWVENVKEQACGLALNNVKGILLGFAFSLIIHKLKLQKVRKIANSRIVRLVRLFA